MPMPTPEGVPVEMMSPGSSSAACAMGLEGWSISSSSTRPPRVPDAREVVEALRSLDVRTVRAIRKYDEARTVDARDDSFARSVQHHGLLVRGA